MTQIKSGITINVNVSAKIQKKKHHTCKKKKLYLESIIKDSAVAWKKIIEMIKAGQTKASSLKNYSNKSYSNRFKLKKNNLSNTKFIYFACHFIDYYITINY